MNRLYLNSYPCLNAQPPKCPLPPRPWVNEHTIAATDRGTTPRRVVVCERGAQPVARAGIEMSKRRVRGPRDVCCVLLGACGMMIAVNSTLSRKLHDVHHHRFVAGVNSSAS